MRATLFLAAAGAAAAQQTITATAVATPELSTLVSLLTQANLANTFANAGPPLYTVFAPTNAAFGTLNANQLSWLTNARAANAAGLVNVLTYHAAGGAFGNLTTLTPGPITTLNNNLNLTVAGTGAAATINGLPYAASIACTNGNVFTLNTGVLVPPNAGIPTQDIPSIAVTVPTLSSLVAALNASNLLPALSVPNGPFTVFAPLNTAFSRLPAGLLTGATLSTALQYHVVPGRLYAAQVAASTTLTSLTGANLTISVVNGTVLVNGYSAVTTADAADAANGVVHFVDSVIMPSAISLVSVATANGLTTLLAAVTAAGLAPTFSNVATPNAFTLFAPTNAAFAAVGNNSMSWLLHPRNVAGLTSVLQYHAVAGARYSRSFVPGTQTLTSLDAGAAPQLAVNVAGPTVTVNGITVTSADNAAYNGVAHVINGVLVPSNSGLPPLDIVATAVAAPAQLSALVAALTGAGLVTALSNPNGPFTVFAPVNSAFARNSPGLLTGATLTTTLQYHVVPGRFYASDLSTMSTVTTLAGTVLRLTAPGGGLLVNGYATVTTADIDCANGVVHLVDFVIMPPAVTLAGVATAAGLSTLVTVASSVPAILAALTSVATPNALTLFAPTNAAFTAVGPNTLSWLTANRAANIAGLTNVLNYHVIPSGAVYSSSLSDGLVVPTADTGFSVTININGATVTVNNATVNPADQAAFNGVAHVINSVLVPGNAGIPTQDIPQVAATVADLSSLVSNLAAANLVPALSVPNGPFTVFAPTNAAFALLPQLSPGPTTTAILQAHVVPGRLYASQLTNQTLATLNTAYSLRIVVLPGNGGVQIWNAAGAVVARVTTADAADCSNGVVHIIDRVLDAPTPTGGARAGAAVAATAFAVVAAAVVTAARA